MDTGNSFDPHLIPPQALLCYPPMGLAWVLSPSPIFPWLPVEENLISKFVNQFSLDIFVGKQLPLEGILRAIHSPSFVPPWSGYPSIVEGWLAPKKISLKQLILFDWLDIIFLQETLGSHMEVELYLSSLFKGWIFHGIEVMGRSRGIVFDYNPKMILVHNIWGHHNFVVSDIYSEELGTPLKILNIYGPCHNHATF